MKMKSRARTEHRALALLLFFLYAFAFTFTFPFSLRSQYRLRCSNLCEPIIRNPRRISSQSSTSTDDGSVTDQEKDESTSANSYNKRRTIKSREKNLYAILGANPSMSKPEIKRLYLSLAKQTHPDSSLYGSTTIASSSQSFTEIAEAYAILSDDKLRKRYDRELAAEEFKDDIVSYAREVAREYGPGARKFYEDWALPFIKRTTASTVAGLRVVTEVTSENKKNGNDPISFVGNRKGTRIENGATSSEVPREMSKMEKRSDGNSPIDDFGRAFQRVIEAGRNATRQIDGIELLEKSVELRKRADEARAESLVILEQLSAVKSERLSLTFHTPSANFSSAEALQFLDGLNNNVDRVGVMGRMTFKNTIRQDIEAFSHAEEEFENKLKEKQDIDAQMVARMKELEEAETIARDAVIAESEARRILEDAQRRVSESEIRVNEAQRAVSTMNVLIKRSQQEFDKSNMLLRRKRDVVRRALRRKDDEEGDQLNTFDRGDNGSVRINSVFDQSSLSMNDMGFETQNAAKIERLRQEEARIESDFLRLVEKASRLVSRSERLQMRSEELIGKQNDYNADEQIPRVNRGSVIGETKT